MIPVLLGVWGWVIATTSGLAAPAGDSGAIQAIQQAPDPSAAVAAFANGFATDRNNPKLFDAYVTRMVDLGLPELAYHQADVLTTLDSGNGLAWGVVGYVNARRGEMTDALSKIVLAGQNAPHNEFVQRTAGEILAWYDLKADKAQIPENTKNALAALRTRLASSAVFAKAYDTAKQAYQGQTSTTSQPSAQPAPTAPTAAAPVEAEAQVPTYATAPLTYDEGGYYPAPAYYGSYYYDWGPGWVAPSPWYWWYPAGVFVGFSFSPFHGVFLFDHHHHHGDFDHHHHDGFVHGESFNNHGFVPHDLRAVHHDVNNQAVWHRDARGNAAFFGTPATPNRNVAVAQQTSRTTTTTTTRPTVTTINSGTARGGGAAAMSMSRFVPTAPATAPQTITRSTTSASAPATTRSTTIASAPPRTTAIASAPIVNRSATVAPAPAPATSRPTLVPSPATVARPAVTAPSAPISRPAMSPSPGAMARPSAPPASMSMGAPSHQGFGAAAGHASGGGGGGGAGGGHHGGR